MLFYILLLIKGTGYFNLIIKIKYIRSNVINKIKA